MAYSVRYLTRSYRGLQRLAWYTLLAAASALPIGCAPPYAIAPDSPLLILEARGSVRVAAMEGETMIELGWIDASELNGLTAVEFDWTAP